MAGSSKRFDIAQGFRHTPGSGTAPTRFLCNRQRNALVKCGGIKRHFTGKRATRNSQMVQVNRQLILHQLQPVNQTADAPRPGTVSAHVGQIGVQFVDRLAATLLLVSHHLGKIEGDLSDIPAGENIGRKAARRPANTDHRRKRSVALWENYFRGQDECIFIFDHDDGKQAILSRETGRQMIRAIGFGADLIMLNFGANLRTPARPVCKVSGSSATVRPGKRICQRFDDRQLAGIG